jgi:hypothetical protein
MLVKGRDVQYICVQLVRLLGLPGLLLLLLLLLCVALRGA